MRSTPSVGPYDLDGLVAVTFEGSGAVATRSLLGNYVTSLDSFGVC
jgi:hypothetical protein